MLLAITAVIGNLELEALYVPELDTVQVNLLGAQKEEVLVYDVMWFAWYAFYPEAAENVVMGEKN